MSFLRYAIIVLLSGVFQGNCTSGIWDSPSNPSLPQQSTQLEGQYFYCNQNMSTEPVTPSTYVGLSANAFYHLKNLLLCPPYITYAKVHIPPPDQPLPVRVQNFTELQSRLLVPCRLRKKPRKVYDVFMFLNEFPQLEIRIKELEGLVYTHVLLESSVSHSGQLKPAAFKQVHEQYDTRASIRHYVAAFTQDMLNRGHQYGCWHGDGWLRESFQRQVGVLGLFDAEEDDIVIHTDADETPSREVVEALQWCDIDPYVGSIPANMYYYHMGCIQLTEWNFIKFFRVGDVFQRNPPKPVSSGAKTRKSKSRVPPPRKGRQPDIWMRTRLGWIRAHTVPNVAPMPSGWHLSFFGGPKLIENKLHRYVHNDYISQLGSQNIQAWARKVSNECLDMFQRDEVPEMFALEAGFLPRDMRNHPEKYRAIMSPEMYRLLVSCQTKQPEVVRFMALNYRLLRLACCPGSLIRIEDATWTYRDSDNTTAAAASLSASSPPACEHARSATSEVVARCEGKPDCQFTANSTSSAAFRVDPEPLLCQTRPKQLTISLSCVFREGWRRKS